MLHVFKYLILLIAICAATAAEGQIFGKKKKNAEELYAEAVNATKAKRYQEAIRLSKEALALQPDFTDQQLLLGRLYMLTQQNDLARIQIKGVITDAPKYRDAYLYAINIELSEGKFNEAECFADDALYNFPGDKELMLKKLGILDAGEKFTRGSSFAGELLNKFPDDTTVQKAATGHYLAAGQYYLKKGNYSQAQISYEKALTVAPDNDEAKNAVTGMYLRSGNYSRALEQVNALLAESPDAYDLLMRKLGLLQDMHQYTEALNLLQQIVKKYPADPKARSLETPLRLEAAAYYSGQDPFLLYAGILEKEPGNREALNKVIALSMSRGAYREALSWINRGLRIHPDDQQLLSLKMDVLEGDRKFTEAAMIAKKLHQRNPASEALISRFVYLKVASGRDYLAQQQYDLAIAEFDEALQASPGDTTALDMTINTHMIRRDSARALAALDNALSAYPGNTRFLLKKSSLLADLGRYDEASEIVADLLDRFPSDEKYAASLRELRLTAGRILLQSEEYDLARPWFRQVLAEQPDNPDALNYLINLESAVQRPDTALYYADLALQAHPGNRDFLLKKAGILTTLERHREAAVIAHELVQRYPFTARYRNAYTDALLAAGIAHQRNNAPDSALQAFRQVLSINSKDSLALLYSINILSSRQAYDSALVYTDRGIRLYPESTAFLRKRAELLEQQKQYTAAAEAADSLAMLSATPANTNYADFLRSKTLKNQFGLFFLHSSYDYNDNPYNIATLEYRRFFKRGSYAVRANYAGRQQGTGLMGEAELYYTHNTKLYSYALAAYSNELVFPRMRLAYSIFKTFKHDIEAELGVRYLDADSSKAISGVTSIAKTFKDFYVNLRAYFISDEPDFYTSFNLTLRHYMNRQQDYISFTAGLGTSPDDRSRLIQFPKLAGLLTRSVGAGYQKTFRYRTTVGIFGTWINQKISDTDFQNQYDIYLSVQRKF